MRPLGVGAGPWAGVFGPWPCGLCCPSALGLEPWRWELGASWPRGPLGSGLGIGSFWPLGSLGVWIMRHCPVGIGLRVSVRFCNQAWFDALWPLRSGLGVGVGLRGSGPLGTRALVLGALGVGFGPGDLALRLGRGPWAPWPMARCRGPWPSAIIAWHVALGRSPLDVGSSPLAIRSSAVGPCLFCVCALSLASGS